MFSYKLKLVSQTQTPDDFTFIFNFILEQPGDCLVSKILSIDMTKYENEEVVNKK